MTGGGEVGMARLQERLEAYAGQIHRVGRLEQAEIDGEDGRIGWVR